MTPLSVNCPVALVVTVLVTPPSVKMPTGTFWTGWPIRLTRVPLTVIGIAGLMVMLTVSVRTPEVAVSVPLVDDETATGGV